MQFRTMTIPHIGTLVLALVAAVDAATYNLADDYTGNAFLDKFDFMTFDDPTHGFVNYVDKNTALSNGLVSVTGSNFTLGADSHNVVSGSARGRDSVRIESQKTYGTHVSVYNVAHMPKGCGTWPAIWEVGSNWPNGGEVDILEGVNGQASSVSSDSVVTRISNDCWTGRLGLGRIGSECRYASHQQRMPDVTSSLREMLGYVLSCSRLSFRSNAGARSLVKNNDCASGTTNTGCGVDFAGDNTFGHAFNVNDGGFYAMERTNAVVNVWFWARDDPKTPQDVLNGAQTVDTGNWGTPDALFPNTNCDIASHFDDHKIVINLTFCGDWAGSEAYQAAGCPSTCTDFVTNSPSEFSWAYFHLMWAKVYEP
ncbi:concanavalin A-like lectin/glucanase domain-containing protein [Amylostereum chailletii]|nr:concanavalin A-like lectin/glucanase domain-containing protein [Amylostereum chailletii]